MGEEKEKRKSVLTEGEIDFVAGLIAEGKGNEQDNILLSEQIGLLIEQQLREVWDAWQDRKWERVLAGVLKIPERTILADMPDCYGKTELGSIVRVSVMMLLRPDSNYLSVEQVKLVGEVLRRIDENGEELSDEPWKTMFFENAKKSFPPDAMKMVEAVKEAGINEQEYIKIFRHMILSLIHNANQGDLVEVIYTHNNFFSDIDNFFGISNLDWREKALLLEAGDTFLARWYREDSPQYLEKACQVYEWLNEKAVAVYRRVEIVEIRDRYLTKVPVCGAIGDAISSRLSAMKIRRIAKKLKII